MFSKARRSNSEKIAVYVIALVTLGINPFTSFEPFNAPKFLFLIILSLLTLFLLLQKISIQEIREWPFSLKLMIDLCRV